MFRDDRFLLAQSSAIRAYTLDGESVIWEARLDDVEGECIAGTGLFVPADETYPHGRLIVATTEDRVCELNLETGKITRQTNAPHIAGNLVAAGPWLVSMGPTRVAAFRGYDEVQQFSELEADENKGMFALLRHVEH